MELEEFMREAEVMQKLRHPRLVKLYGLCTTPRDRPILIVVELVKNGALLQHLVGSFSGSLCLASANPTEVILIINSHAPEHI